MAPAIERRQLTETVGGREIDFELAIGPADRLEVALAPDLDGDGPGIASLIDPERFVAAGGFKVAVNANAFRKLDRKDRNWMAGGAAIVMGEVVTGGVYVAGCEQKRLMFWRDATVGEATFAEAAEILIRYGASEAMNLDGGGSAVMVPDRRRFHIRRPIAVAVGFR